MSQCRLFQCVVTAQATRSLEGTENRLSGYHYLVDQSRNQQWCSGAAGVNNNLDILDILVLAS